MQIESNTAYTSPLYTRLSQSTANTSAAQALMAGASGSKETSATSSAKAAAVTGVTGSNLSKEVMDQLIAATQETDISDTDDYDGPLSIADRHRLEDIARDPEYAAFDSKQFGTLGEFGRPLQLVDGMIGGRPSDANDAKRASATAEMEQVQIERTALYENLTEQGLPPAEIFGKLLEFNADLPESYDETVGWSDSGRTNGMSYSDYNQAQSDYLQNLLNHNG